MYNLNTDNEEKMQNLGRSENSHPICLCFLWLMASKDDMSTYADPTNLSLFLEFVSAVCLPMLSHSWISKDSSLMCQLKECDAGSNISLECFSSHINLPSPQSFTEDILENMGAVMNKN